MHYLRNLYNIKTKVLWKQGNQNLKTRNFQNKTKQREQIAEGILIWHSKT